MVALRVFSSLGWSLFSLILCCAFMVYTNTSHADAYTWLSEQQQGSGEYSSESDLATAYQATAEVLTLNSLSNSLSVSSTTQAYAYLEANDFYNSEYLARSILAKHQQQLSPTDLINQLQSYQEDSGGFSEFSHYQPTLLDSAYALKAFSTDLTTNLDNATQLILYILNQQNSDGSFNDSQNEADDYLTALIVEALWDYRHHINGVTTAIDSAKNGLLGQKGSDNLWDEDFISAQVLIALLPTENDNSRLSDSLQSLSNAQRTNYSWQDDVFTTAKALRAQYLATLPKPDHAGLSGQMVDAETQTLLSGIVVNLSNNGNIITGETDAQGHFNFYPLSAGVYQLNFEHSGYGPLQTTIGLTHGQQHDLGTLKLLRDTETPRENAILQGNITNTQGQPLSDVNISVNGTYIASTDASGYYQILDIPAGDITIIASKPGHQSQQATAQAKANQTLLYSSQLQSLSNSPAGLSGVIVDKQTQQAMSNVMITISGANKQSYQTETDGRYRFENLNPGNTSINISEVGYHDETTVIKVQTGVNYVYSPQLTGSNTTPGQAVAGLIGVVRDNNSQLPLANVTVQLSSGETQQTNFAGQFNFTELNHGDNGLSLSLDNYQSQYYPVSLSDAVVLDIGTLNLAPQANEYRFIAHIVDSTSNQALENVQITLSNIDNQVQNLSSDTLGEISAENLSQPFNQLQISLPEYNLLELDVLLSPLELNDLGQIRLRPVTANQVLADLSIKNLDNSQLNTHPDTLQLSGTLAVTVINQGNSSSTSALSILAYYDNNKDNRFDEQQDIMLGTTILDSLLAVNAEQTINLELQGTLPFRDAPVSVYVDSTQAIIELEEDNNQLSTAQSCKLKPLDTVSAFKPKLKWHWSDSSQNSGYNQVLVAPVVAQLNDDNGDGQINTQDVPDVIFSSFIGGNYSSPGILRALSGADGSEVWPAGITRYGAGLNGAAVGDIDNDGLVEIVVNDQYRASLLYIYEHDGTLKQTIEGASSGYPALADLDNDGKVEIIVGGQVYNSEGKLLWTSANAVDFAAMVFDHDLNGQQEIFANGRLFSHDGTLIWDNGIRGTYAAVGNFDNDDYPEIGYMYNSSIIVVEHTGEIKWGPVAIPGGGGGPLTIADVDGDNQPEIGVAGAGNYVVYETDGSIKWVKPTQDFSSAVTGSSVFDFEGDGKAEILYADERYFRVYSGETGDILLEEPNPSATWFEYPLVVDIDNDNHAEIILVSNNFRHNGTTGIRVFENESDDWMPTRSIWNQHSYHINNINDDGTIPQYEQPSWLSHNSYRLNTFIDRDILSMTDLTAAKLTTDSGGQTLNLSLRVGNASLTENTTSQVSFYADSVQGRLLGSVDIPAIMSGEYLTVELNGISGINAGTTIVAMVDPQSEQIECNTLNNQTSTIAQAIIGQVSLQLDKTQYSDNEEVLLNAAITNSGIYAADYQLQWLIESTQGALLTELDSKAINALESSQSTNITAQWNTANTLAGDYQVHIILSDTNGQVLHETTQAFGLSVSTTTNPMLGTALSSDKSTYNAWDTITLNSRLQNLASNASLEATSVELRVTDPNQSTLLFESQQISALTSQQIREFSFNLALIDATGGEYQASWLIKDTISDTLLSEKIISFSVEKHALQGVQGQVSASAYQLEAGETLTCQDDLSNLSNTAIDGLTVRQQLFNMSDDTLITETSQTINLAGQSQQNLPRDINTQSLTEGEYTCVLQVEQDGQVSTLDYAAFSVTVTNTPIDILTGLNYAPEKGRMLVLMHPSSKDTSHCWGQGQYTFSANLPSLDNNEHYTLRVYDQSNTLLDSESLDFSQDTYPSNQNPAMQGADIVIEQLSTEQLAFSLYTDNRRNGEWLANYRFSLEDTASNTLIQSSAFPVSCAQAVQVGDNWDDFTLTEIPYNELQFDKHIKPKWDNKHYAQRLYLESQLFKAGWDFSMVKKAKDFSHELHSGYYNAYALISAKGHLSQQTQKELREAVYRGESLIVMECSQEDCTDGIGEALGIQFSKGKHSIQGIELLTSPLFETPQSLSLKDKLAKGNLNGSILAATSVTKQKLHKGSSHHDKDDDEKDDDEDDKKESDDGNEDDDDNKEGDDKYAECHKHHQHDHYSHDKHDEHKHNDHEHHDHGHHHKCHDESTTSEPIALTYHHYGQGKAIYMGFDLIKQALKNQETAYSTLLANSLQYLKPAQTASSYQLLPVTLKLENQGLPQTGELRFSLPEGTQLVAANQSLQSEIDANGNTTYFLAVNFLSQPQSELTLWLFSTENTPWTLTIELWLDENGELYHHQDAEFSLALEDSFDLIHQTDWSQACPDCDNTLIEGLQYSQQYYDNQSIPKVIHELMWLTDYLIEIEDTETSNPPNPIRLWLDQGIKQVGSLPHEKTQECKLWPSHKWHHH